MHHGVLAQLWTLSSLLQIPVVVCSPLGASSLVVVMHDPPLHLSVWLISQDIHLEMAAIHQGDPGRATRSLPCLLLNQSLLLFSYLKVFLLPYSIAFFFFGFFLLISILPLAPFLCLAEKPPRTCQLLKPFGCILCLPPSPCFVGVKQRTPCYLWVNRQPWRDASPQAFTA